MGDETIPMNGQEKELRKDGIYVSLSRTQQGETILKVVNVNDSEYTLPLTDGEGVPVEAIAHAWILEEQEKSLRQCRKSPMCARQMCRLSERLRF